MVSFARKKKITVLSAALLSVVLLLVGCAGAEESAAETPTQAVAIRPEVVVPTQAVSEFPMMMESGKLTLDNLFRYDGINPDCQYEEGTDIGAIEITNTSEDFLLEARISAKLSDGTQADFLVTNLPAGKSAMAFAVDNATLGAEVSCEDLTCEAVWLQEDPMPESVTAVSDGMLITLTNNTDQNISELIIYCRCPFDEAYYGGIAYEYTVNDIPAHGQATVEALDCILGLAEAVRIAVK